MDMTNNVAPSRHGPMSTQGEPISDAVADAAAMWLTQLMSGEMDARARQRWMAWRAEHPQHERAWQHIESARLRMSALDGPMAYRALAVADEIRKSRRRMIVGPLLLLGGAGGGWGLLKSQAARQLVADLRTSTGEQRKVLLEDGSLVMLNTDTAVDITFDESRRLLRLVAGEVLIETSHQSPDSGLPDRRPFIVQTREGTIRALGTRFIVRQYDGRTSVAVLESAVEVTPAAAPADVSQVHAGHRLEFTVGAARVRGLVDPQVDAWTRGQLIAADARLGDFITELSRFRRGVLRCAPEVADLRFSGVFPVQDTDRILAMLPNSLPVAIRRRTAYWVTVGPID